MFLLKLKFYITIFDIVVLSRNKRKSSYIWRSSLPFSPSDFSLIHLFIFDVLGPISANGQSKNDMLMSFDITIKRNKYRVKGLYVPVFNYLYLKEEVVFNGEIRSIIILLTPTSTIHGDFYKTVFFLILVYLYLWCIRWL